MSEVSYSNIPPMMAAIKSGDIEAIRSLLHAGHSPNEPQCYHVMIGDWPRDDEASPLELAVLENRMDMVLPPDETARAKMGRPCQGAGPWEADALRGIHTSG